MPRFSSSRSGQRAPAVLRPFRGELSEPTPDETTRGFVRREGVKNFPQHLALRELEHLFGTLDQTKTSALRFDHPAVSVVLRAASGN